MLCSIRNTVLNTIKNTFCVYLKNYYKRRIPNIIFKHFEHYGICNIKIYLIFSSNIFSLTK